MVEASEARRPILELFDIGRDPLGAPLGAGTVRNARSTETLFVERCLRLLRPGGRLGIVLPDGVLNNPTLAWFRDYVEARARLMAVVSIPHEVFASAKATVKTSLVFLQRFTDDESAAWEQAADRASEEIEAELEAERVELTKQWASAFAAGRDDLLEEAGALVALLEEGADRKAISTQRRQLVARLSPDERELAKAMQTTVTEAANALAAETVARVRQRTRELASYPVFMAHVDSAGITGTGDTGPHVENQLPDVLEAYRRYVDDPVGFSVVVAAAVEAAVQDEKSHLEGAAREALKP